MRFRDCSTPPVLWRLASASSNLKHLFGDRYRVIYEESYYA
jgi:hypothetical protein